MAEENIRVNWQRIAGSRRNAAGAYVPDWDALIGNASCEEEAGYIRHVRDRMGEDAGFAWNMVYVTRQKCGHYEIFQTPLNECHPLEENLELAAGHAGSHECTACICGFGRH